MIDYKTREVQPDKIYHTFPMENIPLFVVHVRTGKLHVARQLLLYISNSKDH